MLTVNYDEIFSRLRSDASSFQEIRLSNDEITECDISQIRSLIEEAGKKLEYIQALLYKIKLIFVSSEDTELRTDQWVTMRAYENWFYILGKEIPHSYFFLHEWNHRLYTLIGDILKQGELQVDIEDQKLHVVFYDKKEQQMLMDRFDTASISFRSFYTGSEEDEIKIIEKAKEELL